MMNKPFFSVVIPTYNRAGFIGKGIQSVLDQTFENFELIVVDDGSSDSTEEVVCDIHDKRLRYIRITNGERAAARNAGFRKSQGKYINFLDSDDCLYPHHLTKGLQVIQTCDSPPVFHLAYDVKDQKGKLLSVCSDIKNVNREILTGNVLGLNGVFIRRDVMEQNLFNEDRSLAALEDWELWVRLCARYPFLHLPDVTSTVIQHCDRSVMTQNVSMIKSKVEAFIQAVRTDQMNQKTFGKNINRVLASACTYAALHIALTGSHKKEVARYMWRGIRHNPGELFKRRCAVIIKCFLFR